MPDLHLIGVHEDGRHLLLAGRGGEEYQLPIDDALRAVLRREHAQLRPPTEPMRPTEVQAMIRAGASAEEAAERAGWTVEKVHRYEGPILAERAHIARLAGDAHVPSHSGSTVSLAERVEERLEQRGVEAGETQWDSWRSEDGQWTVELAFPAGGRRRVASWHFSRSSMSVSAVDDEARWLSGDDPQSSGVDPTPAEGHRGTEAHRSLDAHRGSDRHGGSDRHSDDGDDGLVDVWEAVRDEGAWSERTGGEAAAEHTSYSVGGGPDQGRAHRSTYDPDSELTAGLRERAAQRGRRRPRRLPRADSPVAGSTRGHGPAVAAPSARQADVGPQKHDEAAARATSPTTIPDLGVAPDPDAVPLEPFDYDPGRDGLPPAAHATEDSSLEAADGMTTDGRAARDTPIDDASTDIRTDTRTDTRTDDEPAHDGSSDSEPTDAEALPAEPVVAAPSLALRAVGEPADEQVVARDSGSAPQAARAARGRGAAAKEAPPVPEPRHTEPELPLDEDDETPAPAIPVDTPRSASGSPSEAAPTSGQAAPPQVETPAAVEAVADDSPAGETPATSATRAARAPRARRTRTGRGTAGASDTKGPVEQGPVDQGPVDQGPVEQGPVEKDLVEKQTDVEAVPAPEGTTDDVAMPDATGVAEDPAPVDATAPTEVAAPTQDTAAADGATPLAAPKPGPPQRAPKPPTTGGQPPRQAGRGGSSRQDPRQQPARQASRRGRASVPAWDDIMFGAKHPPEQ